MTNIHHLLTPGAPIFDPENLTREILFQRVTAFFERNYIDTNSVFEIRALVLDLSGQKPEEGRMRHTLPDKIKRLHCIDYASLSPVNRRATIDMLLVQMGLALQIGPELLGEARWAQLQAMVRAKLDGANPKAAAPEPVEILAPAPSQEANQVATAWSQKAVALKLMDLLNEPTSISLYDVERARFAVNELRLLQGMPALGKSARDAGFQALGALSLVRLDRPTLDSIPGAILDALALDATTGPALLGATPWAEVQTQFALGMVIGRAHGKRSAAVASEEVLPSTFFQRFWAFVRGPKT